jgi:hypothetical protein
MRMFAATVLMACAWLSPVALAQFDPVADAHNAYTQAWARGDIATAEAAASVALEASEARDGEGGRTAMLAANLAQARIDLGRHADARAPALRANDIAERRGASAGVGLAYTRLLVAQSQLAEPAGEAAVRDALRQSEEAGLRSETFSAAIGFGDWALRRERLDSALFAFETASRVADAQTNPVGRSRAYLGVGMARALRDRSSTLRHQTGTRLVDIPDSGVDEAFIEALRLARPIAESDARTGRMSVAQTVFGSALAWAHARRKALNGRGWGDPYDTGDIRSLVVDLEPNDGLDACRGGLDPSPYPDYPSELLHRDGATAITARIVTDQSGAVTDARIVGAAGTAELREAAAAVLPRWQFTTPDTGCSKARVTFVPVSIEIDDVQNSERIAGSRSIARTWVRRQDRGIIARAQD